MTTPTASSRRSAITTVLLFIVVFSLWQIYDLIMIYISPPAMFIYLLYLAIPAIILGVLFIFTKLTKSTLSKQGYKEPTTVGTSKCLVLSVAFILIYILIYLFPGISTRSFFFQGISTDPILIVNRIASAVLLSLAAESIFRGYIFRNLVRNHGFFTSLYISAILFGLYQVSLRDLIGASFDGVVTYAFTHIVPSFAAGLFLGFFFYKIGWSLLGPATFRVGVQYFLDPLPIVSPGSSPPWWFALTLEALSYVVLIFVVDSLIKEPRYLRRRYGLED